MDGSQRSSDEFKASPLVVASASPESPFRREALYQVAVERFVPASVAQGQELSCSQKMQRWTVLNMLGFECWLKAKSSRCASCCCAHKTLSHTKQLGVEPPTGCRAAATRQRSTSISTCSLDVTASTSGKQT